MISLKRIGDRILQGKEIGKIIQIGMICQNGMRGIPPFKSQVIYVFILLHPSK
jgi:hypothetical protein